jgi:tRNA (Thr-GGU) A37 N-methylase
MRRLAEVQLNTTEGFFVQPVGIIHSCFRQCVGTPRQGALVPASRSSVVLTSSVSPEALDGLEDFSHVWLTFAFHLNTNRLKEAKAFSGAKGDKKKYTFTAKITPPMLKEKKGVFSVSNPSLLYHNITVHFIILFVRLALRIVRIPLESH